MDTSHCSVMCEMFISISCRQAENCWSKEEITFLAHPPLRAANLAFLHRRKPYPAGDRLIINSNHKESRISLHLYCLQHLMSIIKLRNISHHLYISSPVTKVLCFLPELIDSLNPRCNFLSFFLKSSIC